MITHLAPDEAADFLAVLDELRVREALNYVDQEISRNLQKLMAHSPDTAGGLMTSDFIAVKADKTVEEALEKIKGKEILIGFTIGVLSGAAAALAAFLWQRTPD